MSDSPLDCLRSPYCHAVFNAPVSLPHSTVVPVGPQHRGGRRGSGRSAEPVGAGLSVLSESDTQ